MSLIPYMIQRAVIFHKQEGAAMIRRGGYELRVVSDLR